MAEIKNLSFVEGVTTALPDDTQPLAVGTPVNSNHAVTKGYMAGYVGPIGNSTTVDPTINDDTGDGYGVGSKWINTTSDLVFECVDATVGAAVWKRMGFYTDITDHTSDTTDAHAASAITSTPSGNLVAVNVQTALNELQTDIDTRATSASLTAHTGAVTGAHAASAISNIPSGNLAAVNVQTALDELQTDIDTRATSASVTSAISAHEADTTSVHGITDTSLLVTTTGTQTLSAKTFSDAITLSEISTPSNPSANKHKIYPKADGKLYRLNSSGTEVEVGAGAGGSTGTGSLAIYATLKADDDLAANWSTGNNASFLGGGSIAGTFALNSTTPISGTNDYKYTQASGSLNDYFASAIQSVPVRSRGIESGVTLKYFYDGADNDLIAILYDVTNASILTTSTVYVKNKTTVAGVLFFSASIPTTCTQIRVGFKTVAVNSGKIFRFDDLQVSDDPFVYKDLINISDWETYTAALTHSIGGTSWSNQTTTGKKRRIGSDLELEIYTSFSGAPANADGPRFVWNLPTGHVVDTTKLATSSNGLIGQAYGTDSGTTFYLGAVHFNDGPTCTQISIISSGGTTQWRAATPFSWGSGDTISIRVRIPITGWTVENENIIAYSSRASEDSMIVLSSVNGYGSTGNKIRRWTNNATTGSAMLYVPNSVDGDSILIKENGLYSISYSDDFSSSDYFGITKNSNQLTTGIASPLTAGTRLVLSTTGNVAANAPGSTSWSGLLAAGDVIRAHTSGVGSTGGIEYLTNFTIAKLGQKSLVGLPTPDDTLKGYKTYITNNGDYTIEGFLGFTDSASSTPTDGAGGATPTLTLTRTTTSPLRGSGSFLISHPSSNTQGQGWSYDFTLDRGDLARIQELSFETEVTSGTMASGDLTVWFYNKTTGELTQPSGYQIQTSTTGYITKQIMTFQTHYSSTSYRMIIYSATSSTTAFDLKLDNFKLGPQVTSVGPVVTDWIAYTPTLNNVTLSGSSNEKTGYWRRVGDSMEVQVTANLGASGSVTAEIEVQIPSGYTIDSTKISNPATYITLGSIMGLSSSTGAFYDGVATWQTGFTNKVRFTGTGSGGAYWSTSVPATWGTGPSRISTVFSVPILGWSASQLLSQDAGDNRPVIASYKCTTADTTNETNAINYDTKIIDTLNCVTTSATNWKFTAPCWGYYRVSVNSMTASASTLCVIKNFVTYLGEITSGNAASIQNNGTVIVELLSGEYISIVHGSASTITLTNNDFTNRIHIERIPTGNQQIAASETVGMRYTASTTTVGTSDTELIFTSKDFDTHGVYSTSTGRYPCPVSGKYLIIGSITSSSNIQSSTVPNYVHLHAAKNGTSLADAAQTFTFQVASTNINFRMNYCSIVNCLAGETLSLIANRGANVGSFSLSGNSEVHLMIMRIGN